MAFFNSVFFLTLLVAILASMAAPSFAEVADVVVIDNIIYVNGTVRCVDNTTLLPNDIPFANATVELKCGKSNTTIASNTTNASGNFTIIVDPPSPKNSSLGTLVVYLKTVKNCTAVVTTPLTACNSTLRINGTLQAPLSKGPIDRVGFRRIFNIIAAPFSFNLK